jgi:hypothetical protein
MKYSVISIFIFFIFQIDINSQSGSSIKGKVLDKIDNEPLVGVNILIEELKTGTVTD